MTAESLLSRLRIMAWLDAIRAWRASWPRAASEPGHPSATGPAGVTAYRTRRVCSRFTQAAAGSVRGASIAGRGAGRTCAGRAVMGVAVCRGCGWRRSLGTRTHIGTAREGGAGDQLGVLEDGVVGGEPTSVHNHHR